MLGDAMSIFARSTRAPFGNSPARMRANRSRFSAAGRSRQGDPVPGDGQRAARLADLVGRQVVHVGEAALDEVDGPRVQLLEVVRRVEEVVAPVEAQPADVGLDGVDVLLLLLDRVRVVEPQVAAAAELRGDAEVEADRLRVADVEVAVRLGREAGDRGRDPAGRDVGGDDVADEVAPLGCLGGRRAGVAWLIRVAWQRRGSCNRWGGVAAARGRTTLPEGVGWRARIRTWNPLIQSQVLYR